METQVLLPIPFEILTDDQKKEICNGCGGKGSWVVPPKAIFFKTDCDHHDYGYWKGITEEQRLVCDKKLKESMLQDCARLPWYKKPLYYPWAHVYYIAVRKAGDNYFHYGKEIRWPVPTQNQIDQLQLLEV